MIFTKLNIRTLLSNQLAQMVEIENNCGLPPYSAEILKECIENLDTYAFLENGNVIGYITINSQSKYLGGSLYIANLNVSKDHQRKGIGEKLIRRACECYRQTHKDKLVSLDVEKTNIPAFQLYRKLGFLVSDIPSRNGGTDVIMFRSMNDI